MAKHDLMPGDDGRGKCSHPANTLTRRRELNLLSRGYFLSLDGLDGTGKSTQCRQLAAWLSARKIPVTLAVDPGGTQLGQRIREFLLYDRDLQLCMRTEALLFMASRAELVEQVIRPALARGDVVLSDRFILANVVYQGYAGGLSPEMLWSIGDFCSDGLRPDLTIVLDLPVPKSRERRASSSDRLECRGEEYHQKVRDGFLQEARRFPESIQVIDAQPPIAEVTSSIIQLLLPRLKQRGYPLTEE